MGDDATRDAGVVAHVVGPGHLGHRHQRLDAARGRETGIGADIGQHIGRERDELAVLVERAFERHVLIAAMEARHQVLAPVLGPRHRGAQLARQHDQHDEFARERHLLAEPAADVGRDHAQIRFRHADQVGNGGPHQMRHLRRAGERDAARCGIEGGMRAARLHRQRVLATRARVDGDDLGSGGARGVEARRLHAALDNDVRRRLGMDTGSSFEQGGARIDDGIRLLDLDLDLIGDVLGRLRALRQHSGNRLSDVAHDAVGEDRLGDRHVVELVQHRPDRLDVPQIGRRHDGGAIRSRDAHDASGGHGAAHEAHVVHRRQIAGEASNASDQRRILEPPDRPPDPRGACSRARLFRVSGHAAERSKARRVTVRTRSRR